MQCLLWKLLIYKNAWSYVYFTNIICTIYLLLINIRCGTCQQTATGCTYNGRQAVCDFTRWDPPLSDRDFEPQELHSVIVEKVNGAIPTQVFSDLRSPSNRRQETFIELDCGLQDIFLGANVFTSNLDWMESLYIKTCYIQSGILSSTFENLTGLTKLEIAGGGLVGSIHSDSLRGLVSLTSLIINADFPENEIPSGFLLEIPNVKNIDLKSSGLTSIAQDAFSGLLKIQTLDLSYNHLKIIPEGVLEDTTDLKSLDLSVNSLTGLPQVLFNSLFSLTFLDLSENDLSLLPKNLFDSLAALQTLDLSDNSLATLPVGILDNLADLETLDLSTNSLAFLPDGLFDSQAMLQTLKLADNSLITLPENCFHPLLSITSATLENNPWNCSCGLFWLSTWSLYTGILADVDCSSPEIFRTTVLNRAVIALNCTSVSITNETVEFSNVQGSTDSTRNTKTDTNNIWQSVTLAVAGGAIVMSIATVFGACILHSRLKRLISKGYNLKITESSGRSSPVKSKRVKRLFSKSNVHSTSHSDIQPYCDVHYNLKF